jgi:hypothetical protein
MFGWLKRGKPAHPMADPEHVQELIASLSASDPAKALERISGWLDGVTHAKALELPQRWQAVGLLDQAASARRRKLAQDYVSAPYLQKADEERLWNASFEFWKALAAAYLRCIEGARAPGAAKALDDGVPALFARRALRASSLQLKWILLRHGQPDPQLWRDLGGAYAFAESHGIAELRSQLYAEEPAQSSAREELLRALMLTTASPDNLAPLRLHLAERIIAHFSSVLVLRAGPAPDCAFAFDLALGNPPLRAGRQTSAGATTRFFGAGTAEQELARLAREIGEKDAVPGSVNLGGSFDQESVLAVLAHLQRIWDTTPPARRAERSEASARVSVVPGLPNVLRCLELIAIGSPLDPKNFAEQEMWTVVDRSDGGYGAVVPQERGSFQFDPVTGVRTGSGDWLAIGTLLALREERSATWSIGVIRRITLDASGQRRVGIQLIPGLPLMVRLAPASGIRAGESERRRSAIMLSNAPDQGDEALVVMRAGHYTATQSLSVQLNDEPCVLQPAGLIEGGGDFDCARFRILRA